MDDHRLQLAVIRAEALYNFYVGERLAGADALTANERMHEHAKHLDSAPNTETR